MSLNYRPAESNGGLPLPYELPEGPSIFVLEGSYAVWTDGEVRARHSVRLSHPVLEDPLPLSEKKIALNAYLAILAAHFEAPKEVVTRWPAQDAACAGDLVRLAHELFCPFAARLAGAVSAYGGRADVAVAVFTEAVLDATGGGDEAVLSRLRVEIHAGDKVLAKGAFTTRDLSGDAERATLNQVNPFGHAEQMFKEPFGRECRALFADLETALWGFPPLEGKIKIGTDLR